MVGAKLFNLGLLFFPYWRALFRVGGYIELEHTPIYLDAQVTAPNRLMSALPCTGVGASPPSAVDTAFENLPAVWDETRKGTLGFGVSTAILQPSPRVEIGLSETGAQTRALWDAPSIPKGSICAFWYPSKSQIPKRLPL